MTENKSYKNKVNVDAKARILERLKNPPDLGKIKGKLSREEIYEDIT